MKKDNTLRVHSLEKAFTIELAGETLVTVNIAVPQLTPLTAGTQRINRHYKAVLTFWERYARGNLAREARKQYTYFSAQGFPFAPFSLTLTYTVLFLNEQLLSVVLDRYEYTGGANGFTVRQADTWYLASGFPLHMKLTAKQRKEVCGYITNLAQSQQEIMYFEPLPKLVCQFFRENQFYLTPEGVAFFYGEVTIAPHAAGIQTFVIPYEMLPITGVTNDENT